MSLETYDASSDLYLARGEDVNGLRPLFTGDVVLDVAIPGVQDAGPGIVVAHPCNMRGAAARLGPRLLMAAVGESDHIGRGAWTRGHFGLMPLPDLLGDDVLYVARLDEIGRADTDALGAATRIACLTPFGVNLLQQRLIFRLTRHEVPTYLLQEASAHVFEEADLLEEWSETVCGAGASLDQAVAAFDAFMREDRGEGKTRQSDLRDPQRRSVVRGDSRDAAKRMALSWESGA